MCVASLNQDRSYCFFVLETKVNSFKAGKHQQALTVLCNVELYLSES